MTNPTPHGQVPGALIDLIDAYAETRHRCGCAAYNAQTAEARRRVTDYIEAIGAGGMQSLSPQKSTPTGIDKAQAAINSGAGGVQALSAAPARWELEPWLPIETAPMDGTAVLVMRDIWPGTKSGRAEQCNGHNTYVAQWWDGERGGDGAWVCYMDAVCDPECPIIPTHWKTLPPPPAKQQAVTPEPGNSVSAQGAAITSESGAVYSDLPELTSAEINDACWAFVEAMPHNLPGPIWNDLKPAVYAAICKFLQAAPKAAPGELNAYPMAGNEDVSALGPWQSGTDKPSMDGTYLREFDEGDGTSEFHQGVWLRDGFFPSDLQDVRWRGRAAPQQEAQEPTEVPYQKLTNEIDLILSDPDTELSIGAKRALLWMRTWVSVPLFTAPQPAPAPLSEMPYEKRKAIQEGEQISASDAWFHARFNMLDTLDRRNVFRAGFDRGWNAALAAQGGKA